MSKCELSLQGMRHLHEELGVMDFITGEKLVKGMARWVDHHGGPLGRVWSKRLQGIGKTATAYGAFAFVP